MHIRRALPLVAAVLFLAPAAARADSLSYQLVSKVAQGQQPLVRVHAGEAFRNVLLDLNRGDGKHFGFKIGNMAAGAVKEVKLPGDPVGPSHWVGRLTAVDARGEHHDNTVEFDTVVAPPLEIQVDKAKVDLKGHELEVRLSRAASHVEIKVFDDSGSPIAEEDHSFSGKPAGSPLRVTWSPRSQGQVMKITLKAYDEWGFYSGVTISPWSVYIPHEEVSFRLNSADIDDPERPKLEASLQKITDAINRYGRMQLGDIKLFIAGHSDTTGAADHNLKLSQLRAQSIALWFRKRGLRIPIAFEGFGEHALLVKTADEVNEARNRRVDYILSIEPPQLKATNYRPTWRAIK